MVKLSEYAKKEGISYRTAYNHFKNGLIPTAFKSESGSIYIKNIDVFKDNENEYWINVSKILKESGFSIRKDDI
jgi:predicted site-specific integrase-resolvase